MSVFMYLYLIWNIFSFNGWENLGHIPRGHPWWYLIKVVNDRCLRQPISSSENAWGCKFYQFTDKHGSKLEWWRATCYSKRLDEIISDVFFEMNDFAIAAFIFVLLVATLYRYRSENGFCCPHSSAQKKPFYEDVAFIKKERKPNWKSL